jgi:hypothetical protein
LGKVPTVIFESGGGGPSIAGWDPIVADIAKAEIRKVLALVKSN